MENHEEANARSGEPTPVQLEICRLVREIAMLRSDTERRTQMLLGAINGTLTQGDTAVSRPPTADELSARCVANTVLIDRHLESLRAIHAAYEELNCQQPVIQSTGLNYQSLSGIEDSPRHKC